MKTDMSAVRRSRDDQLKFSKEEITANKAFWTGEHPRIELPPENPWPSNGHWDTHLVSTEEIVVDSVAHMTPHWDQMAPYNVYCPLKSWSSTVHVPAGCVAVAGAEVLYYLHYKIGVPEVAFGTFYMDGDIPVYGGGSAVNWDLMDPDYQSYGPADKEAILIRRVGDFSTMTYADTASSALFANLRTSAFPAHNISCSQRLYNQDTVKRHLDNRFPILVAANEQLLFGDGHCFVIDGFKKTRIKSTYLNIFITEDFGFQGLEPYETVSYTSPEITAIKINWGWWDQWDPYNLNDGWYTLTGDWSTVDIYDNETSYNYYRKIIYDFKPTDEP